MSESTDPPSECSGRMSFQDKNAVSTLSEEPPPRRFRDYLPLLRERYWLFIVVLLTCVAGACLKAYLTTPLYRGTATLQVLRPAQSAHFVPKEEGRRVVSVYDTNTQIGTLESIDLLERVVGGMGNEEKAKILVPYRKRRSSSKEPSVEDILMRNRAIVAVPSSRLIMVHFTHPDSALSAAVSNRFAKEFLILRMEQLNQPFFDSLEKLRHNANRHTEKIGAAENALVSYCASYPALSLDPDDDPALGEIRYLSESLVRNEKMRDELETQWILTQQFLSQGRELWELGFIASLGEIGLLRARLSDRRIEHSVLKERYRHKHPRIIAVNNAIGETERELRRSLNTAVEGIHARYLQYDENYKNLEARIAQRRQQAFGDEEHRRHYQALLRNLRVAELALEQAAGKVVELQDRIDGLAPQVRIVAHAHPSSRPFEPDYQFHFGAGIGSGLLLGSFLVVLLAYFDDRVKVPYDIEAVLGLPLIGIVPELKAKEPLEKAQIVIGSEDRETVEAFRSICASFRTSEVRKRSKCILITSTAPDEGKSLNASNLSLTFAGHDERTLLIDCDLRMPNVAEMLELNNACGLIDCFERGAALDDVIVKQLYPDLDVLPTGGQAQNPTRILSSSKFADLLGELRTRYDRIVLDAPPLAPVSDALTLLPVVDCVIYVVRFDAVKRKTARYNARTILDFPVPRCGVILNDMKRATAGRYFSHRYDRSYRDYYTHYPEDFTKSSG